MYINFIYTVHMGLDFRICGKMAAIENFFGCPNLKGSNVVMETTVQCDTAAMPISPCCRLSGNSEEMPLACTLLQQGPHTINEQVHNVHVHVHCSHC